MWAAVEAAFVVKVSYDIVGVCLTMLVKLRERNFFVGTLEMVQHAAHSGMICFVAKRTICVCAYQCVVQRVAVLPESFANLTELFLYNFQSVARVLGVQVHIQEDV